jgi:serine/threonine-protein kinase RsbW
MIAAPGPGRRPVAPLHVARFRARPCEVRTHLAALDGRRKAAGLPSARFDELVIVLGEVLNNVVEHAFVGCPDPGWIDVEVVRDGRSVRVALADDGAPLPPALLRGADLPAGGELLDDLPEGGFGWFIVHSLVDDMTYERDGGRNVLSFSVGPGSPPAHAA